MISNSGKSNGVLRFSAGFAIIFGALTLLSGSIALFSNEEIRSNFGNVVQLVLWFNFLSGFWYILTGIGLLAHKPWAVQSSVLLFLSLLGVNAYLGLHILGGGAFELRTVAAMVFRTVCWFFISLVAIKQIRRR